MNIRNIAIIAHVDHGKTTLVDKMIYACNAIDERKEQKELILDWVFNNLDYSIYEHLCFITGDAG